LILFQHATCFFALPWVVAESARARNDFIVDRDQKRCRVLDLSEQLGKSSVGLASGDDDIRLHPP
jgi:hypothetical protein